MIYNMSTPSSRERAQRLYEKNIELENRRRRAAQARIPSDPNAWQHMRENYEAIILEDHDFSEQHNIEYALWQLHYKRIEEMRALFSSSLSSNGLSTSQGGKGPTRPDQVSKIRMQFRSFLSEATGFYHDLIQKIRAKHGLAVGYLSEDSGNRVVVEKDGRKISELSKGLLSCHRCLIYLGDLARYKGLYGDGDSRSREYAAASSYYLQAASLWPSSGNPHHQLAILASYLGDELVAVYRYFRSLAVDSPFSTARGNLIVAFEKNRQSYSQQLADSKAQFCKENGHDKGEAGLASKDTIVHESYKSFCVQFVRLNGIIFTRTSLETFSDILSSVSISMHELMSSGPEEELNFGSDPADNALAIIRIVSILVFTVHNLNKESESQTYADILQRNVLLKNAYAAVFELMGNILERCGQLQDPLSSFLLPGIMVFVEWLASYPEIAAPSDVDEQQGASRSKFWNICVSFFNKILSISPVSIDGDEDGICFSNMSLYEEGETETRLALWEDFELRGFLPLLPAQSILDFSKKQSFESDGRREKQVRVKRILTAGKVLSNVVMIDDKAIHFDPKSKRFVIGFEPQIEDSFCSTFPGMPDKGNLSQEAQAEKMKTLEAQQANPLSYVDGEDDDEVIVFKPMVPEKQTDVVGASRAMPPGMKLGQIASASDPIFHCGLVSSAFSNLHLQNAIDAASQTPLSTTILHQHLQPMQSHTLNLSAEEETSLANGFNGLRFLKDELSRKPELQASITQSHFSTNSVPIQQLVSTVDAAGIFINDRRIPGAKIPSMVYGTQLSGGGADNTINNSLVGMPTGPRKGPVSRPVRHHGPPPGFSPIPSKQLHDSFPGSEFISENPMMDDYSWLDGYQFPSSTKGPGLGSSSHHVPHPNPRQTSGTNVMPEKVSFPFPGKQLTTMQSPMEGQKGQQAHQITDSVKLHHEQLLLPQQQVINGNQLSTSLPEQCLGNSVWTGRYFV